MADPLWRQIAEDLRQKIESGELGAGGRPLPTELDLQAEYRASRNTIRDAIKWLVTRNLVYTRSGQGTFVTAKVEPFVTLLSAESGMGQAMAFTTKLVNLSGEPTVSVPQVGLQKAGQVAAELQVDGSAVVITRHQQRVIDGVPYSRQTSFYPKRLVDAGAERLMLDEDIEEGAVKYLQQTLNLKEAGWLDQIRVRAPDAEETAFFGIPDDGSTPVFEIIRIGYDEAGQPLRVTITTYPADRNQFAMTSGNVPDDALEHQATGKTESRQAQP